MSKLMDDLNDLNDARKIKEGVIVDETLGDHEPASVARQGKGMYVLSFLVVLLIVFSAFSVSISLKTFSQLEDDWASLNSIQESLNMKDGEIKNLEAAITENNLNELERIVDLKKEISGLSGSIGKRDQKIADILTAYNDLKVTLKESVEELEMTDKLILRKYILLNDEVKKLNEQEKMDSLILNSY